jgi:DNA-binding NtrC family response regulator
MKNSENVHKDFVLFVDDEENILRSLTREFIDMPYGLLTATSAEKALEIMCSNSVSVIISDQRMTGTSGTQLLSTVREQYPDVVRILLTAFSDMQDVVDAINMAGIYKFIQKPWITDELKKIIAEAVDQYHLMREKNNSRQVVIRTDAETENAAESAAQH